jgi:tetratricopeptide (TPR) repeat protein
MAQKKAKKPQRAQGHERTARSTGLTGTLALIAITCLAYLPAFRAGFVWDDPDHVLNNYTLRSFGGLAEIWFHPYSLPQWYPLTHTSFWIEYLWWGPNPAGYHATNVLLHTVSAVLLWRLLVKLDVPGAWLAAAVFAVHPVGVESVGWVTERKNVLSLVFYLAAMHVYLFRYAARLAPAEMIRDASYYFPDATARRAYFTALGLFLAALFSKSVTFSFPVAVLLIVWWKRGRLRWPNVISLIPFFVAGIAMGFVTSIIEHEHVGASGANIIELRFTILQRLMIAGRAVWFYAGKLLWPSNLIFIYPRWPSVEQARAWNLLFGGLLVVVIASLFMLRRRIGRGPLAAVLLFCGTLFPALGFVNVYPMRFSFVADHFQYHASIPLIALVVATLWRLLSRSEASKGPLAIAPVLLLAPLVVLTYRRAQVYQSAETLWRDALAKNKSSWMIYTNLANDLVAHDQYDEAERLYESALDLAPHVFDTHRNVGMMLARHGRYEEAMREFAEALRINPVFAPAYYGMAVTSALQNRQAEAEEYLRKALELAPHYPEANWRMGKLLEARGQIDGALQYYRTAIAYNPAFADARYDLATLLIKRGEYDEAMANLLEVVRLQPNRDDAWQNLGYAQLKSGHADDADFSLRRAAELRRRRSGP